jgi:hypothetical protein
VSNALEPPISFRASLFEIITYPGKYTSKRASEGRSTEEERNSVMLLLSFVPHGQVEDNSREESTLSNAQKEARYEEASHVLRGTQESSDDAPGEC